MRFRGGPFNGDPEWVHWLFLFLIVVAIVAGILLIVRMWGRPHTWRSMPPPPPNPALTELDLRYARGEMSRDEYLQRKADLLGHIGPPPGMPGGPGAPSPPAP